jgi:Uma2 family endonuclease
MRAIVLFNRALDGMLDLRPRETVMTRPKTHRLMTEEEFLRSEEGARIRHEFVGGYVFAMTGSSDAHNVICGNIFAALHARLRGGTCLAYMNDMKVKIRSANSFYYPDIVVTCEGFAAKSVYKEQPILIVEILSPSTRQIDLREKLVAYQKIESLKEYIIVHQDRRQIEVFRQLKGVWENETIDQEQSLFIRSLPGEELKLAFNDIYGDYNPPSRVKEEDAEYECEMSK